MKNENSYMATDAIAWIVKEEPFSDAFRKKVLGSLRKMKKLPRYNVPLNSIPVSIKAFDAMWGRGPIRDLPNGFKSVGQFQDWRSQARSGLVGFLECCDVLVKPEQDPDAVKPEFASMLTALTEAGLSHQKLISASVLGKLAGAADRDLSDIDRQWLQNVVDSENLLVGQRRAVQEAFKLISLWKGKLNINCPSVFDGVPLLVTAKVCVRVPFTPCMSEAVAHWAAERRKGQEVGHRLKRRSSVGAKRVKSSLLGVSYVYTAMMATGLVLVENPSVQDLAGEKLLDTVIEIQLSDGFLWQNLAPSTLYEYINNWKLFLKFYGVKPEPLNAVIRDFVAFENIKGMSESRKAWCEDFLGNHHKQAVLLSLPLRLYEQAAPQIAAYETLSGPKRKSAIALAIAACAAAILTSLPLRISTLMQLTVGGEDGNVQTASRTDLTITTPGAIVKNGYSHRAINLSPKRGGNPLQIVKWFTENVRSLLLSEHISRKLVQPELLFCGVDPARMRSIWTTTTLHAGVPMTPHQIRHALATLLANEPSADYDMIAALLGDTVATIRKNYVFVDRARKNIEGQNALAAIQKNILIRGAKS